MTNISPEEVQQDVSGLLERVQKGEVFVIAQDGKPLGRLEPVRASVDMPAPVELNGKRRFGFLEGQIKVPDDFNEMVRDEIEEMFYGKP